MQEFGTWVKRFSAVQFIVNQLLFQMTLFWELSSKQLIFMIKPCQNHFDITTTGQGMVYSEKYLQHRGSHEPCENLSQANESWLPYYHTWKG